MVLARMANPTVVLSISTEAMKFRIVVAMQVPVCARQCPTLSLASKNSLTVAWV